MWIKDGSELAQRLREAAGRDPLSFDACDKTAATAAEWIEDNQ
jgi:hypothetical protein